VFGRALPAGQRIGTAPGPGPDLVIDFPRALRETALGSPLGQDFR
jgi:hypothetical protein